jgi:CheY-like chemotaxis protein
MNKFQDHKFLLVDDSDIDSIITSKILQLSGLDKGNVIVKHAQTGLDFIAAEAKDIAKTTDSDLIILLDIHMPEMTGFDFLAKFEQMSDEITDKCKVFLLTSSIDPSDIERADQNRFVVRVLNKPLNTEELLYYFE